MTRFFILCDVLEIAMHSYCWAHKDLPPKHYQPLSSFCYLNSFLMFYLHSEPSAWKKRKGSLSLLELNLKQKSHIDDHTSGDLS